MPFAQYVYAGPAGPGRGGTRNRSGATKWVVLHTSEGGEGPTSAENLAAFIRTPSSGDNVASYHLVTDTDRVLRIMADELRCNGGAGANDGGLHVCMPGRAAQPRELWLDSVSAAYIDQAARATADWCLRWKIPADRVFAVGMRNDVKGITDHNQVRLAFGQTTHTDVGPGFPWDVFMGRVLALLAPVPPPPAPPIAVGGHPVFVATWQKKWTYLVQLNVDGSKVKRLINNEQEYLHLIGAGVLPVLPNDDGTWDAWIASIPEYAPV
jgi:hypothetical protein